MNKGLLSLVAMALATVAFASKDMSTEAYLLSLDQIDANSSNNVSVFTILIEGHREETDISVSLVANKKAVVRGDQVMYIVNAKNEGEKNATNIKIRFNKPENSNFISSDATTGKIEFIEQDKDLDYFIWHIPILVPGESAAMGINVKFLME